jgi:hypothetical protein
MLHDGWFGATVSDHDQGAVSQEGNELSDQLRIELLNLFDEILVRELLGAPVQPARR